MFEINLIKDQVMPISKKVLRTFILASYFILILFVTIIIFLISVSEDAKIKEKEKNIADMTDTIAKTKKERDDFDASLDKGRRINQEIEKYKAPWENRINFAQLLDHLIKAWDDTEINKYATILSIKYNANYLPDDSDSGKVVITGWFADDVKSNPIPGAYDKVTVYALKTLEKLKTKLLNNSRFKSETNVRKITVDANSNGYDQKSKTFDHVSYFKIVMETETFLYPRPVQNTEN